MKTLSNTCLLLGTVLCFLVVDWNDVRLLANVNASCYTGGTYTCLGESKNCPSQRCIDLANPGTVGPHWRCAKKESGTFGTISYYDEEKYLSYWHHVEVAKDVSGRSGLNAGVDKPCRTTGACGCGTPATTDDSDQAPFCSSPTNVSDGPNEVKVRTVDVNSDSCVGE